MGLKVSTICLGAARPRRRTSSWLKSAWLIWEASSTQMWVSSPLGKVMDFSFSRSSSPLNTAMFPFLQVTRRSVSRQVNSWETPHWAMIWRNRA